ncbi:hypothetical protein CYY_008012 [Polysphondylium violaceum]|uniref:EGF-like domain-containing protein n=1 Tax=Polysphondylium violaceum TaxID=133409 RepID=A0A8J4V1P8_9MYCE|nr:hypothetical protein CYY_008012 [Polysphondylium violaceum]
MMHNVADYDYNRFNDQLSLFYVFGYPSQRYYRGEVGDVGTCNYAFNVVMLNSYVISPQVSCVVNNIASASCVATPFATNSTYKATTDTFYVLTVSLNTQNTPIELDIKMNYQDSTFSNSVMVDYISLEKVKVACYDQPTTSFTGEIFETQLIQSGVGVIDNLNLKGYIKLPSSFTNVATYFPDAISPIDTTSFEHVYNNVYQVGMKLAISDPNILSELQFILGSSNSLFKFKNPWDGPVNQIIQYNRSKYDLSNGEIINEFDILFENGYVGPISHPITVLGGVANKAFSGFVGGTPPLSTYNGTNKVLDYFSITPSKTFTHNLLFTVQKYNGPVDPSQILHCTSPFELANTSFTFAFGLYNAPTEYTYPFGLVRVGQISTFSISSFFTPLGAPGRSITYIVNDNVVLTTISNSIGGYEVPPTLASMSVALLEEGYSSIKIKCTDSVSGVLYISLNMAGSEDIITLDSTHRIVGDPKNGVYEKLVKGHYLNAPYTVSIFDFANNALTVGRERLFYYYGVSTPSNTDIKLLEFINLLSVSNNDINVTNKGSSCRVNILADSSLPYQATNSFMLVLELNPLNPPVKAHSIFNSTTNMYQIDFTIPAGLMTGTIAYTLVYNSYLAKASHSMVNAKFGANSQIRVTSTPTFDHLFPVVEGVSGEQDMSLYPGKISLKWSISFSDTANFKSGSVTFASVYNKQGFTLPISANNPTFTVEFQLEIELNNCKEYDPTEFYYIQSIETEDVLGNKGKTVRWTNKTIHPFYKFDAVTDDYIYVKCLTTNDISLPQVNFVKSQFPVLDTTSSSSRNVEIDFNVFDDTSPISKTHLPVCYFLSLPSTFYSITAKIKEVVDTKNITWTCLGSLPYGFGSGYLIPVSIYGIYDTALNYIGYSAYDLATEEHLSYIDARVATAYEPFIQSTSTFYSTGGTLIIYGNSLGPQYRLVYLEQSTLSFICTSTTSTYIKCEGLPSTTVSFHISLNGESAVSNIFIVNPVLVAPDINTPSPTPTATSTPSCSSDCGEPLNYGKCINGACVCIPPHNGFDCKANIDNSTVIKPNPTQPTVNITIPGTSSGQTPQFTSFVSVVALHELDSAGTLLNNYQFNSDKWILVNEGSSSNDQVTTVQYKYVIDNSLNTTIVSTVQVFAKVTNITFGNQQLYMNPSTIKFTFNITSYPFTKSTNALQVIMTAALESSKKVACSYKEFIDDQSNSQYLRIQIEDRSLFGRFIKFGMVDGREQIITNTVLDSSYGGKDLSTSTSDQSYIGLNVPYYTKYALLDPDFSVLVETRSARDQANSVCTSESSKKLTNAQLAGIIVGGVVFVFIVCAIAIYLYTRKSTSPIAMKLRRIGK